MLGLDILVFIHQKWPVASDLCILYLECNSLLLLSSLELKFYVSICFI